MRRSVSWRNAATEVVSHLRLGKEARVSFLKGAMGVCAVILAAGQGTRLKSNLPKVLHPVAGQPMIVHAINAVQDVSESKPILVVGVGADPVIRTVGERARYVVQEQQLGTGHAVLQARSLLASLQKPFPDPHGSAGARDVVLVTYADMPLLAPRTLQRLVEQHQRLFPVITILTVIDDNPRGFGRVLRNASGSVVAVIEEPDATPNQLAIRELNCGVYCFNAEWLWVHLDQIPLSVTGEYYLTDLVGIAVKEGSRVEALTTDDPTDVLGVNNRVHLAEAEAVFRQRINRRWMLNGVTFVDPATAYVESEVTLGVDTVVYPNTVLEGSTSVGTECEIGPNSIIRNSTLGDRCVVTASVIEGSILENGAKVGPFEHVSAATGSAF